MYLKELIEALENTPQNRVVKLGFCNPHSYRGSYEHLAFEPAKNVQVSEMLEAAKSAVGKTFMGYKGGNYVMDSYSKVYLAEYGMTGEELGPTLLHYMLLDEV